MPEKCALCTKNNGHIDRLIFLQNWIVCQYITTISTYQLITLFCARLTQVVMRFFIWYFQKHWNTNLSVFNGKNVTAECSPLRILQYISLSSLPRTMHISSAHINILRCHICDLLRPASCIVSLNHFIVLSVRQVTKKVMLNREYSMFSKWIQTCKHHCLFFALLLHLTF